MEWGNASPPFQPITIKYVNQKTRMLLVFNYSQNLYGAFYSRYGAHSVFSSLNFFKPYPLLLVSVSFFKLEINAVSREILEC